MTPDSASDVFASDAEGRRYRTGVFDPIDEAAIAEAPDQGRFPARGTGPAFHRVDELPRVPRVRHLIAPPSSPPAWVSGPGSSSSGPT